MTDEDLRRWIGGYERAWRTAGTELLRDLFAPDATYLPGPYETPRTGLARVEVRYPGPRAREYRDLWVITLDAQGRATAVEEWPFHPGQPLVDRRS